MLEVDEVTEETQQQGMAISDYYGVVRERLAMHGTLAVRSPASLPA